MATTATARIRQVSRTLSAADHPGTIRSFYPYWDTQYRPMLLQAALALPAEHFGFKPRPEMLTAHQIVLHIAECELGWIHYMVEGGPDEEWVVPHEDPAQGWVSTVDAPDHAALLRRLEECHRYTQKYFDLPVAELGRVITHRSGNGVERRATLHWVLDHLQEHEIHHRAQLNLYLRLLEITPPSI